MSRAYQSSRLKIPAKPFISTWNTAITYTGSTANNQIRLPLLSTGIYKFTVNWGDNTSDNITTWNQPQVTHTYAAPGTYTVTITGFIKGWDFSGQNQVSAAGVVGDRRKLTSITQFGCLEFVTFSTTTLIAGAFYQCTNLTLNGLQDYPNFKNCTQVTGFLRECTGLVTIPGVNKWDVSKVTWFRNFFREAVNFNDNVGNWNMSRATDTAVMFRGSATIVPYGSFNNGGSDSIKNWDMSKVTNINAMFYVQRFFNQEIGLWDISNVTDMGFLFTCNIAAFGATSIIAGNFNNAGSDSIRNWNTSKVTNMSIVFSGQGIFNQPIGDWDTGNATNMSYMLQSPAFNDSLNNWDVSKVTNMDRMMQGAIAYSHPLNNWQIPLVTNMTNFMYNSDPLYLTIAFSKQNYSDFLISLASQTVKPNVPIRVNQFYSPAATAARAVLTSAPNNWTIVDLGVQP
jgi:hypothetical protein